MPRWSTESTTVSATARRPRPRIRSATPASHVTQSHLTKEPETRKPAIAGAAVPRRTRLMIRILLKLHTKEIPLDREISYGSSIRWRGLLEHWERVPRGLPPGWIPLHSLEPSFARRRGAFNGCAHLTSG